MAVFYYSKKRFPHTYVEINDHSIQMLPSSPTDNECRQLSPLFSDFGPDDRTILITSETAFVELFGQTTVKRHGWLAKGIIKHLRAGGVAYVRRLTDESAKNANVSLNVTVTPVPDAPIKKYLNIATGEWTDSQPSGEEFTNWTALTLTTTPSLVYASASHANLKTKDDAELLSVTESGQAKTIPLYVLMRTGAGNNGNKTVVQFNPLKTLSNHLDSVFECAIQISTNQVERYRVCACDDSRFDSIPLNLKDVLNKQSFQVNAYATEANRTKLKADLLEVLTKLIADFGTAIEALADHAEAKAAMEAEKAKVEEIKAMLTEDDIEATALTSIFGANHRFPIISALLEAKDSYITSCKFANGTNGIMFQGKFDWNYSVERGRERTQVKIYESLVKSFFEGVTEPTILDFNLVPADIIHDIGYPVPVKMAISNFTSIPKRRDIVATICPSKIKSIAELKSFDENFKLDNYQALKIVNWSDTYDFDEQKTFNVPATYLAIDAIVKFFKDGWHDPILAGRVIAGVVSGTTTPVMNILTDEADKTYLVDNAWNYLSTTDVGYILDGQKTASTDPYKVSILQEFHNAVLITRIMKKITNVLNRNRHFIQRPDKIKNVMAVVNKDLEEFRSKCASVVYNAYYKDEFDEAEGLLTDDIDLTLFGSNKSHKLQLDIYRYSNFNK